MILGRVVNPGRLRCSGQFIQPSHQYLLNAVQQVKQALRQQCTSPPGSGSQPPQKLSLFAKFKSMYKDYWYVLVPVHVVTSVSWFGAFYKASQSGVDLAHYLRKVGVGESVVKRITESGMGDIAVAGTLYAIATPIRHVVTLVGTIWSIIILRNMGYIKPAKELMAKRRARIQESLKNKK